MLWIFWICLTTWANVEYPTHLDAMEHDVTQLRSTTAVLNDYLSRDSTQSIPMLQIESIMLDMDTLITRIENQHATLP